MRKLIKCLFLILLMQFMSVVPGNSSQLLHIAHATPAIKVSNDTISEGNVKLAQFSLMGVAIEGEKNIKDDNGNVVYLAEGRVDPAVNALTINISGFNKNAAKAGITIKAYDNDNLEGEVISSEEHFMKTQEGERMNLDCKYDIAPKTKSLIIELKYNSSLKIYKLIVV